MSPNGGTRESAPARTPATFNRRERNSAIWRRETGSSGEKSPDSVPWVTPSSHSREIDRRPSSSSSADVLERRGLAIGKPLRRRAPAVLTRNRAIWDLDTGSAGEKVDEVVPVVIP